MSAAQSLTQRQLLREQRLLYALEELARRRSAGEPVSDRSVQDGHPDLMPELAECLCALERVEEAERWARSSVASRSTSAKFEAAFGDTPMSVSSDSFPGCEIVEEIYRGGQGVVYRAKHHGTARDVAIKVMRDGPFRGSHDRARFDREVRILAQLKHPNIVAVHDSGVAAGRHYFVMDYIAGQPLDRYVTSLRSSSARTLRLFVKICRAVDEAHLRGIIHRDLKPSNIRIDERGEPHVLDFGLAKFARNEANDPTYRRAITMTGQFVGSMPWASPEQVDDSPDQIDLRSDVYSLGVILYQMLTGRFPYDVAGNMRDLLNNILEADPRRPSEVRRGIGDEVDHIVLKCLAKERELRYPTAGAAADDVERYLAHQPILARAPSTIYQLRKLVARHKLPSALIALLLGLVSAFAVSMGVLYRRADAQRDRAETAERQASHKARTALAVKDFLVTDMLASVGPDVAQGSNVTVEEVLENASQRIDDAFPDEPLIEAAIRAAIGQSYVSLGLYDAAEPHLTTAAEIRARELGEEHPDTLRSRAMIVDLLSRMARYDEADLMADRTWKTMRRVLGEENEETLRAAQQRAMLHFCVGRVPEAEALLEQTLETRRLVLGDTHPDTLASLTAWGSLALFARKKVASAEAVFRSVLDECTRVLGDSHPQTLAAMSLVAQTLTSQRKFDRAEETFRESLDGHLRVFGDKHPNTLTLKWRFAQLRQGQGRLDEAIALLRETVDASREVLGERHALTLQAMEALGHDLAVKGDYAAAESIHRQTLEAHVQLMGDSHMTTAHSLDCLGMALHWLGRYAEAEECFRKSHRIVTTSIGDVESGVDALRGLVRALAAQDKQEEARPFAENLLRLRRDAAEEADTDAYRVNCYARTLLTIEPDDLRDPPKALEFALKAFGMSSDAYHYNRYTLALAYEANGDVELATEMAQRALDHIPVEVSQERAEYESALVRLHEKGGDDAGAERVYRDTLAARRDHFPAGHLDVSEALARLGKTLIQHGSFAEAELLLRECLEIRLDALPGEDWRVGEAMSILGSSLAGLERFADARRRLDDGYAIILSSPMAHSPVALDALDRVERFLETAGRGGDSAECRGSLRRRTDAPPLIDR